MAGEYRFPFWPLGKLELLESQLKQANKEMMEIKDFPLAGKAFGKLQIDIYQQVYPRLSWVADMDRPDVMICDFASPACRDVAKAKGIPLITGFQTIDGPLDLPGISITQTRTPKISGLSTNQRVKEYIWAPIVRSWRLFPSSYAMNKMRKKFGHSSGESLLGDFSMNLGLANTFVGFEPASYIPPNIHLVGPLLPLESPPLTPELKKFIDMNPRTVYVAFGSILVPTTDQLKAILTGLSTALEQETIDAVVWGLGLTEHDNFPTSFLFNNETISTQFILNNRHPSFRFINWAPQLSVLRQKNVRLFITHAGLESSFEAIHSGTPMICVPYMFDQPRNAMKLEAAGIALTLYPNELHNLSHTIHSIFESQGSIRYNTKLMKNIATTASKNRELAIDLIEEYAHAAKYCYESSCETKHLLPASLKMSSLSANSTDVHITLLILITFSFFAATVLFTKLAQLLLWIR
ncbi:hypothetical protein DSO57_1026256 [Entomophthora muscae]|uniref:Uncharacterized protein n=1 Tax=Entomophthora muscae TaxID=34485 RepID=A0ACC2RGW2_9FUNG|nr:hypothetical protein DSO57_1026256 [Entomophthora muscae]